MKKSYYIICLLCFISLSAVSYFIMYRTTQQNSISKETSTNVDISLEDSTTTSAQEAADIAKEPVLNEVLLTSVGDITLGSDDTFAKNTSLPTVYENSNDPEYLFRNVSNIFKNDTLTIGNLETTFTKATVKKEKKFNFKGDPTLANSLVLGGIEGVNISNNHIYDYNQQGFNDTIQTLKNYNINYFGEGNKWLTTVNGIKFAFLGYQGWNTTDSFLKQIKKDIDSLKAENRVVVINFHWGEEGRYTPNNIQKKLAHYAIDNGADLIIGHHPHVIEGIEKYKDRYIAYSLGNFCFGGNSNPPDKDTIILQSNFKFEDGNLKSIGIKVIPCSISSVSYKNDYCPTPLTGKESTRLLERLNSLNMNMDSPLDGAFQYIDIK